MLKERLGLPVEGAYPKAFVERYPEAGAAVGTLDAAEPSATRVTASRTRSLF